MKEKKKILIVEDNEKNLKLMKMILDANNYTTIVADNGKTGVEMAKQEHPDLILMDIQMPVMDGIDAIHVLREYKETSSIPIIATTAYAMKGDKEKLMKSGFSAYIAKPIRVDKFLETIDSVLDSN